jgi:Pyruvate/2-oxoacid:ferredoxin oxidoreductase gamma subunit
MPAPLTAPDGVAGDGVGTAADALATATGMDGWSFTREALGTAPQDATSASTAITAAATAQP